MALGLNIVVGFAGLLDLGYVAFFAIGAYTMGWFGSSLFATETSTSASPSSRSNQPGIHLNWLLCCRRGARRRRRWAPSSGFPTLRLRGDYIAIVTLAFGEIIGRIAINSDEGVFGIGDFNLTNGRAGITPVDKIDLPFVERFTTLDLRPWYWTALALALFVLFVNFRLRDSRIGRAWIAIREDEVAADQHGHPDRAREAARLRDRRGDRRHGRHVPRLVLQHGQRRPVRVLVLDLRAGDDHPRRPRVDLGRGGRGARALVHQHAA